MTDAVIGTPSVVGFATGGHDSGQHDRLALNIDAGERTRDVLFAGRFESQALNTAITAVNVAVEKTSAAAQLTIEKTASASQLAVEKLGSASQLFAAQNHAAALAQAAACCCEIKELVRAENGQTRDLINSVEANRVRAELADAKNELLAIRLAGTRGNGNGN